MQVHLTYRGAKSKPQILEMVTSSNARSCEIALFDLFVTSTAEEESGLKNRSQRFIGTACIDFAEKRVLDKIFDGSINCWTKSTSFMDAFPRRTLAVPGITRPLGQFFKTYMVEAANESYLKAKGRKIFISKRWRLMSANPTTIDFQ